MSRRPALAWSVVLAAAATTILADVAQAELDPHRLPVGDGRVSTVPVAGSVMSCTMTFRQGGAAHTGAWFHGDTWDMTEKLAVRGEVLWPFAAFTIATGGVDPAAVRVISTNGLPVGTATGIFPVARTDPAFAIDRNPNPIRAVDVRLTLPANPVVAAAPSCVPMGMIGIALNGVAIYNALDAAGLDAVAHEVQDLCGGHPQGAGQYHYHGPSACLPDQAARATLIGYALDGFGIFSRFDRDGRELTNADLDACHGRVALVEWDGQLVEMYHYVLTLEYPYTIGCFAGTPVDRGTAPRGPGAGGPVGALPAR